MLVARTDYGCRGPAGERSRTAAEGTPRDGPPLPSYSLASDDRPDPAGRIEWARVAVRLLGRGLVIGFVTPMRFVVAVPDGRAGHPALVG